MIKFRAMTFNVRGIFPSMNDGVNAWEFRSAFTAEVIRKYSPDVIGFQEMQKTHWNDYLAALPEFERSLGPEADNQEPYCYMSIFWKPDVFEKTDEGKFWLSPTPEVYSKGWGTSCVRSANWTRLRPKGGEGFELLFLDTHLDHGSRLAKIEGARLIAKRLEEIRRKSDLVLVTADFNSVPGSDVHSEFAGAGFADTFLASGRKDGPGVSTGHGFGRVPPDGMCRIDWILAKTSLPGVTFENATIATDNKAPLYPSDHYPYFVDVAIGQDGRHGC